MLGTDRYQLVHECGRQDTAYDESLPAVLPDENVWCSQYNPISSQPSKAPHTTQADPIEEKKDVGELPQNAQRQPADGSSREPAPSKDSKRPVSSTDPGDGSSKKIRSSKGKGKVKISIGADGSLSGF